MTAFNSWLLTAKKGETLLYHRGLLGKDRWNWANNMWLPTPLHTLGLLVWTAYKNHRVILVQKRNGEFDYDYYAIKR